MNSAVRTVVVQPQELHVISPRKPFCLHYSFCRMCERMSHSESTASSGLPVSCKHKGLIVSASFFLLPLVIPA